MCLSVSFPLDSKIKKKKKQAKWVNPFMSAFRPEIPAEKVRPLGHQSYP